MKKVLSIQSHTVYGYVGNKAAVFPLQLLGFDVASINTVQFSNHTGYARGFTGEVMSGAQFHQLQQGLAKNSLLAKLDSALTGYIGSSPLLEEITSLMTTLRQKNAGFFYCCDPVLGDHGKGFYVPKVILEGYKTKLLPLANMITPNQFEAEQLTGRSIYTQNDVLYVLEALHAMGPQRVIITSTQFAEKALYASVREGGRKTIFKAMFRQIRGSFTGTGDLLAALLLGWSSTHYDDMELVLANSLQTMQAVLSNTQASIAQGGNNERELALIASKDAIIAPPKTASVTINCLFA